MPGIPVVGPGYESRQLPLSAQKTRNMWLEINPEARSPIALHSAPGLKPFAALEGIDRGMHDFGGAMYAVNGASLYRVDADGTDENLGAIAGTDRCIMASDSTKLMIATGGPLYMYTVAGGVETVTDPDVVNPTWVAYLNNQFILDVNDGAAGVFQTTEIGSTFSVNALDFATAEAHPDDILRGIVFSEQVYFFGEKTIEVWWNSGVGNPPFSKVQNQATRPFGVAGRDAVTTTSEYIYFLDHQRIPRRSRGLDFPSIGTPALGVEFAKYSRISDCIVYDFVQDNQQFVVFTFPTANRTWCYHEQSNTWSDWTDGVRTDRHRATALLNIYGLNYCADHTNGNIYELDPCTYNNNGKAMRRQRDTGLIHGGLYERPGAKLFFEEVEFVFGRGNCLTSGTGAGPQPVTSAITGVCAATSALAQGNLLSPHLLMEVETGDQALSTNQPDTDGYVVADSKSVSFTVGFWRSQKPADDNASAVDKTLIHFYDAGGLVQDTLNVYMGKDDGYIYVKGYNASGTLILSVTITNGASHFADGSPHLISFVANLDDATKREVFVNGTNVTDDTAYVTWTTYTDDLIKLKGTAADDMTISFGQNVATQAFGELEDSVPLNAVAAIGYICFDNECTLVSAGIWDDDGFVRDPQGDFTGWFTQQPKFAYGPSFWKAAGAYKLEKAVTQGSPDSYSQNPEQQNSAAQINGSVAGSTDAEEGGGGLPPPPTEERVPLASPHWDNLPLTDGVPLTGNWVSPSAYTQLGWEVIFGMPLEDTNYSEVNYNIGTSGIAIPVTTADPDIKVRMVGDATFQSAAIVLVDSDGDIVDWCWYSGSPAVRGTNVAIPSDGLNYYLICTSNTGRLRFRVWDSTR